MTPAEYLSILDSAELLSIPIQQIIKPKQGDTFIVISPNSDHLGSVVTYCRGVSNVSAFHWFDDGVKSEPQETLIFYLREVMPYDINGVSGAIGDVLHIGS